MSHLDFKVSLNEISMVPDEDKFVFNILLNQKNIERLGFNLPSKGYNPMIFYRIRDGIPKEVGYKEQFKAIQGVLGDKFKVNLTQVKRLPELTPIEV